MEKTIDDICVEIDALTLRSLELMEDKVGTTIQMETVLRNGHIELAKSKYILGKENVSILQVPTNGNDAIPLFQLDTKSSKKPENGAVTFDISSRKLDKTNNELKDPIKWFGVLVPQNLRTAQKKFQDSLYLSVRTANIQSELISVMDRLQSLHSLRRSYAGPQEKITVS